MTVLINVPQSVSGRVGYPLHITAQVSGAKSIQWRCSNTQVLFTVTTDHRTLNFTPRVGGNYQFQITASDGVSPPVSRVITVTVGSGTAPAPIPQPTGSTAPSGSVIYDSRINSQLHNGIVRTITQEGNVSPGGLGIQCRASGNPRIRVNQDKTFSLLSDGGHGRFYVYAKNYNVGLWLTFAWGNQASGQDCSLKARSRHNEGGATTNRFGGYGLAINRTQWDAKREVYHNVHDESMGGSLPIKIGTQQYVTVGFTIRDTAQGVLQEGYLNGNKFMQKLDKQPQPYMLNKAAFAANSYFWVRQNIASGTGELRVQALKLTSL
jgi:hypothetical protein